MTELKKTERAKMYIDKLANGINPIDDTAVSDNDVVNNVRVSRCLFYVSDVLRQVIENGGVAPVKKSSSKHDFYLTENQIKQYKPCEKAISVSEITKSINSIVEPEQCKQLKSSQITNWLLDIGALEIQNNINGKATKLPTSQGSELGISSEIRVGLNGEYRVVVYNKEAQQFIVDNIETIIASDKLRFKEKLENQGQPWTQAQDECLIELFNKNVPISEIAVTLMRTSGGIKARLKKLGLIEKRSDI